MSMGVGASASEDARAVNTWLRGFGGVSAAWPHQNRFQIMLIQILPRECLVYRTNRAARRAWSLVLAPKVAEHSQPPERSEHFLKWPRHAIKQAPRSLQRHHKAAARCARRAEGYNHTLSRTYAGNNSFTQESARRAPRGFRAASGALPEGACDFCTTAASVVAV